MTALSSDLFLKAFYHSTDTDSKVELLNNYWQQLWRTASSDLPAQGVSLPPAYMQRLNNDMSGWWDFHTRYFDSVFKRALDPRDLWGGGLQSTYQAELGSWKDRFVQDLNDMLASAPKQLVTDALTARNVDPDMQFQTFPESTQAQGKGVPPLLWGLGAGVLLIGFGIWASHTSEGYRRSQPRAYYSGEPRFQPRSRRSTRVAA